MSPLLISSIIALYFSALLLIAYFTSKNADSDAFFTGKRQSPWYLVAFGMIGTSLSGVTFISVPGAVGKDGFSYFQIVLGYVIGYLVIATVLMPLYYRLNLVSIYSYLEQRFGFWSYKTGAFFFILSRTIGSSLRLYLAAEVLQLFLFDAWNVPFAVTVAVTIVLIWVYTYRGGIKTIVWTDTFQTFFLVSAVIISVLMISDRLELSLSEMISTVADSKYSQIFHWGVKSDKNFFKHLVSGAFLAIVMTGLDQDLMQKNLTCKSLKDAQKNMLWFTITLVFVNLLFLTLGALLYLYVDQTGFTMPERSDLLYPTLAFSELGIVVGVFFLLGIIASSYASSDSALAALTTSFCIDFLNFDKKTEAVRQKQKFLVHIAFSFLFFLVIIIFRAWNDKAVIKAVLGIAAYTYGPLLGLYAYGVLSKRKVMDRLVPLVCVLAPLATYFISINSEKLFWGYKFSFEILLVNGFITALGLYMSSFFEKREL